MASTVHIRAHNEQGLDDTPRYATVAITGELIARIRSLQELVATRELAEAAVWAYPEAWRGGDSGPDGCWRMESEVLVVTSSGYFYFRGLIKHTSVLIETQWLELDEVLTGIAQGETLFGELEPEELEDQPVEDNV